MEPKLGGKLDAFRRFCRQLARGLDAAPGEARGDFIEQARNAVEALVSGPASNGDVALQFCSSVVVDVVAQGWTLKAGRTRISLRSPTPECATPQEIKQRIRAGHLFERDAQLREDSVAEFIKRIEQRRLAQSGWNSIFSLMRDGRELAAKLRLAAEETAESRRTEMLASVISPYIQVVETDAVCSMTGLKLTDIWRYFRHTWVSTYKSLPGRSMLLLVRDAAAPHHPVIGIAALGSSMAQQTLRDEWIGWDSEIFVRRLEEHSTVKWCRWVYRVGRAPTGRHLSERFPCRWYSGAAASVPAD